MKKFTFLIMAVLLALTVNAQIAVTCAEAVAAMPAQSGTTTEETYVVTGYVTYTNGVAIPSTTDPSIDQQTFFIDDVKGSSQQTVQGYWCNLPLQEEALNVGDKITITGHITNYNNIPEFKKGDVAILEREPVVIDTINASVCDVIEEGKKLNSGESSVNKYRVCGRINNIVSHTANRYTLKMTCEEEFLTPYNCYIKDSTELGEGDSIVVIGKLYNYNGTIEIYYGRIDLINSVPRSGKYQIGDLFYQLDGKNQTAEVTYQNLTSDNYAGLTEATIPSSIIYKDFAYTVTCIGYNAFYKCSSLISVEISNGITSIGNYAFSGCKGLTAIEIPNSITSVGDYAFNSCSGLTSITIPNSVTSIGDYAFAYCSGLKSIEIPNSVIHIGDGAFNSCHGLTSIVIPNSVTEIGGVAFHRCSRLASVTINSNAVTNMRMQNIFDPNVPKYVIGESVTSIGSNAFEGCTGLTSITIPNSVTSIGSNAFEGCTGLTSIEIPNSVTSIGWSAFRGCSGLTSVTLNSNTIVSQNYSSSSLNNVFGSQVTEYIIGESVTSIGNYAFEGCTGLTSITIPNSVTSIGGAAFSGCTGLTSFTIPNSVISIGSSAFYGCTGLTSPIYNAHVFAYMPPSYTGSYTILDGIESISGSAFEYCSGLTNIEIPQSVTSIGSHAFYGCTALTSMTIPNSITSVGDYALYGCTALTSVTAPTVVFEASEGSWMSFTRSLQTVTFTSGELTYNVLGILSRSNKTLTSLDISAVSNTELDDEAIKGFYNLQSLVLPAGLTKIGYMAVADCKNLQSITIPASVTEIDNSAFENCRSLSQVIFAADPQLQRIGNWAFYNCHTLQNIAIPEGVTEIGDGAFYGCTYLEKLNLPASISTIGDNAFALCSKLKRMDVNALMPPTIVAKTFYEVSREAPVYVPDESVDLYKSDALWGELNIISRSQAPTGIDNTYVDQPKATKILHEGQILILRSDHIYTLTGQEIK